MSTMKDLLDIIGQVDEMEKQLGIAVTELQSMRQELETMREESHPIKTALQNAIIIMQGQVLDLRDKLAVVKQSVIDGCKNALDAFKEKGLSALRNVSAFFKLRPGLEALRDGLTESIRQDEAAMAKIEAVSAEYHVIARVGSTGNSTGPHLDLEVLKDGELLNPLYFVVIPFD